MTDPMETQQHATERLQNEGYETNLWIAEDGTITSGDESWEPASGTVRHVVRFEGESNPDDEAILLAVEITGGPKGLLSLPYGPDLSGPQAETVKALTLQPDDPSRPSG